MNITDNRKLQTQKDYSIISNLYQNDFGKDYDHFSLVDEVVKHFKSPLLNGYPIVDLGCGSGVVTDYIALKGVENIKAIDITPAFCEMVKKNHPQKVEVICTDMVEYLKQAVDTSVGAYIANYSVIHIPDEEVDELFKNIHRTLANNGLFLMSCHKGSFKGMEQEPYQQQKDERLKSDEQLESYMNYFMEDELKNRIEKVGLRILSIDTFETKDVPGEIAVPKIWVLAQKQVEG